MQAKNPEPSDHQAEKEGDEVLQRK